jgi:hypothetical protein
MSESLQPRFAVDLNEIERQLAQAGTPPVQPNQATRSDPLAELARIVGQDDPFQAILANDASARPRQQASSVDDLFAVRDNMTPSPRPMEARGAYQAPADQGHYPQAEARRSDQAYGYQHAAPSQEQDGYDDQAYGQDYYDDNAGQYAADYGQAQHMGYAPVQKTRSRRGMMAIGAVVGAVVLGVGAAYVVGDGSSAVTGGEPPVIEANNEPTKVQPQNPGGVEIPNQNKQIYERAQQSTETKVVNREEQPVDVEQAVRMNSDGAADATGGTVQAQKPANGLNLGEPRKVRTVAIRPDGAVAHSGGGSQQAAVSPIPTMTLPAEAQPAPPAKVEVASTEPTPVPAQPRAAASTPAAPTAKPAPAAATPASSATPQKVASAAQPVAPAPAAAATTTAVGGFSVQLGLANSEGAAESALAQFQRKYPDLEGLSPLIRKAEVNGNTIYRVRVGPMSRDEASSLCSKLQGQGGQCFVAKN